MRARNRYLKNYIEEDLSRKMVFLYGPRQVGKTTLALNFSLALNFLKTGREIHPAYFNWDYRADRKRIQAV